MVASRALSSSGPLPHPHPLRQQLGFIKLRCALRLLCLTTLGSAFLGSTGPSCSPPANPHQTQTSPSCRGSKTGWGEAAAASCQCSALDLLAHPRRPLSLGYGGEGLGAHHLLNTGSAPLPCPLLLWPLESSIRTVKEHPRFLLFTDTPAPALPASTEKKNVVPIAGLVSRAPLVQASCFSLTL